MTWGTTAAWTSAWVSRLRSGARIEQWTGVVVALADASSCPAAQLLGLVQHPVGVASVLSRSIDADLAQGLRIFFFVLVHEDLEDVSVGEQLRHHQPLRCFMGAH